MDSFIENSLSVFNNGLLTFVLLTYLLIATYTDLKYMKIYDKFNMSLVAVRVIFMIIPIYTYPLKMGNVMASISIFIIMLTIGVILMHKMGGDIKFITALMLFFDMEFMFIFMAISSLLNLVYLIVLKKILLKERKKVLEEFDDECKNNKENVTLKDKINYNIIKIMMVKQPTVEELISMNEKDLKKYRVPFAPFFLMSYIILVGFYHLAI